MSSSARFAYRDSTVGGPVNLNRARWPHVPVRAALVALVLVVSLGAVGGAAVAATCTTNAIVCENARGPVTLG